jgi:hypothetical protein
LSKAILQLQLQLVYDVGLLSSMLHFCNYMQF